jgi:hypothetical protein
MKKLNTHLIATLLLPAIFLSCENTVSEQENPSFNQANDSKSSKNLSDFEVVLSNLLLQSFSEKNFDSLLYVSSPLIMKFTDPENLEFGRFYNPGIYCKLFSRHDKYGFEFQEGYYGQDQPDITGLAFFSDKQPEGGYCEESVSPDGIYYNMVNELPDDWDLDTGEPIPLSDKYKDFEKMEVQIQIKKMIVKTLYFIKQKNRWYLLFVYDCDCSA